MSITKNFRLEEFQVSKDFPDLAKFMTFTYEELRNIELLCIMILQPIREILGSITIISGKRSPELNEAIKGSKTSDHLSGSAVDIVLENPLKTLLFCFETEKRSQCMGQLILYIDALYRPRFVHVSLPTKKHYQELMINNPQGFHKFDSQMFLHSLEEIMSNKCIFGI